MDWCCQSLKSSSPHCAFVPSIPHAGLRATLQSRRRLQRRQGRVRLDSQPRRRTTELLPGRNTQVRRTNRVSACKHASSHSVLQRLCCHCTSWGGGVTNTQHNTNISTDVSTCLVKRLLHRAFLPHLSSVQTTHTVYDCDEHSVVRKHIVRHQIKVRRYCC